MFLPLGEILNHNYLTTVNLPGLNAKTVTDTCDCLSKIN